MARARRIDAVLSSPGARNTGTDGQAARMAGSIVAETYTPGRETASGAGVGRGGGAYGPVFRDATCCRWRRPPGWPAWNRDGAATRWIARLSGVDEAVDNARIAPWAVQPVGSRVGRIRGETYRRAACRGKRAGPSRSGLHRRRRYGKSDARDAPGSGAQRPLRHIAGPLPGAPGGASARTELLARWCAATRPPTCATAQCNSPSPATGMRWRTLPCGIRARGALPPVWTRAHTGARRPILRRPLTRHRRGVSGGARYATIGDRLKTPLKPDSIIVGSVWFLLRRALWRISRRGQERCGR